MHHPRKLKRALDIDSDSDADPEVRRIPLDEFSKRFGFHIPVFLQAPDRLVGKLARRNRKKMVSFISLAEISTDADLKIPDREAKMDKNKKLAAQDQQKRGIPMRRRIHS